MDWLSGHEIEEPVEVVEQVVPGDVQLGGGVVVALVVRAVLIVVGAVVVVGGVGDTQMSELHVEYVALVTAHEDVWPLLQEVAMLTIVEHVVIGEVQLVVEIELVPPVGLGVGGEVCETQISAPQVVNTPEVVAQLAV